MDHGTENTRRWQVRAIAAIMFAVGRHEMTPREVLRMTNLTECPVKPSYMIAPDDPLLLHSVKFPIDLVKWGHELGK
jgi:tRNA U38,U39,U40 pseudouridine synthase TruA